MKNREDLFKVRTLKEVYGLTCIPMSLATEDHNLLKGRILDLWSNGSGWVLGHAMDGLLWGKIAAGRMVLANDADPTWGAPLKRANLLDLRVFNRTKEMRIWPADGMLQCCLVYESQGEAPSLAYDEHQIFIAGKRRAFLEANGVKFSLIEGPSGQCHAIPVDWNGERQIQRLWVRHYVFPRNDNGMLAVTESRLLDIAPLDGTKE